MDAGTIDDDRIFVSIASYRDPDLPRTIQDAIDRAARPDRLRFGICHQHDADTVDDLEPWADDPRFSFAELPYTEARGVGWARARVQDFYDHEPYYLQIDAHMRFVEGWDDKCIDQLDRTGAERPIVTNYPRGFEVLEDGTEKREDLRFVRRLGLEPSRDPGSLQQRSEPVEPNGRPGRHPFVAAGHLFTLGRFVRDVPYDPQIYYHGEEIALAIRAYTHGYDLFWPDENLLWHWYDHGSPLHWSDHDDHHDLDVAAQARLERLFTGDDGDLGRYGLGGERTVLQYQHHAGFPLPPEA